MIFFQKKKKLDLRGSHSLKGVVFCKEPSGLMCSNVTMLVLNKSNTGTESVGNSRLHAVRQNMGDAVLVLRLGQDDDPNVPQGVNGHLDARSFREAL